jgi:hypothetical protein
MDVSEATKWFVSTPLSGYNGIAWVSNISKGDFNASELPTVEREFLAPKSKAFNAVTYPLVKTPDGTIWVVDNIKKDYLDTDINATYFLVESTGVAQIYSKATVTRASGAAGTVTETLQKTTWCRAERYGSKDSSEFTDVKRGLFEITLPHGTTVNSDWLIKTGGRSYEIDEVYEEMFSVHLRTRRYDG